MKRVKKGDVILVIGYESVLAALQSNDDVDSDAEMRDSKFPIIMAGNWGICPGDLFYCKVDPNIEYIGDVPKKLQARIDKLGYWWEVRLKTIVPRRSK